MDEQFDPGGRYCVVDHVVRPGWDGPGLIRSMNVNLTRDSALELAARLEPRGDNAVAVRVMDLEQAWPGWVDA